MRKPGERVRPDFGFSLALFRYFAGPHTLLSFARRDPALEASPHQQPEDRPHRADSSKAPAAEEEGMVVGELKELSASNEQALKNQICSKIYRSIKEKVSHEHSTGSRT